MRVRLLILAGLAALASLPGPASARTPLRPVLLRPDLRPSRLAVSPLRPIALRPMRWLHERIHRGMATTGPFAGRRAVVGLAEGADGATLARDYGVSSLSLSPGLRAHAEWMAREVLPVAVKRTRDWFTGRSPGDGFRPKRPELLPVIVDELSTWKPVPGNA